jgi:glycyl-tRNA synthetase beta chain
MLVEKSLPLAFHELTRLAFGAFTGLPAGVVQDRSPELDEFLIERLKSYFREAGYSASEVDAAIHARQLGFWATIPQRLTAVRAFMQLPEAPALAAANKRVGNILKKSDAPPPSEIDAALLAEPAEIALAAALESIAARADAAWLAGDYAASLQTLAGLKTPVDGFFDTVMVHAEDPALKANRLALLGLLHQAMNRVADLSRLAG